MANNYAQATLYPDIPSSDVTELEIAMLQTAGWQSDRVEDGLYFFAPERADEDINIESLGSEYTNPTLVGILDARYYYRYDYKDILNKHITVVDIFQNIISRSSTLDYVTVEGACTCDKMRRGEFGGFAYYITSDSVKYMNTSGFLAELLEANHGE